MCEGKDRVTCLSVSVDVKGHTCVGGSVATQSRGLRMGALFGTIHWYEFGTRARNIQ